MLSWVEHEIFYNLGASIGNAIGGMCCIGDVRPITFDCHWSNTSVLISDCTQSKWLNGGGQLRYLHYDQTVRLFVRGQFARRET